MLFAGSDFAGSEFLVVLVLGILFLISSLFSDADIISF